IDRDLYVFAAYAALAAVVAWRLLPTWRRMPALWPALAATVGFAVASQGLDMLSWEELSETGRRIWGPAEEILKTTATFCGVLYSGILLECAIAERIAITSAAESADPPERRASAG